MKDPFLRYSKWIQFITDKIFCSKKYLVLNPWGSRIGHLVIEVLTAASVAKRDNKILILIPELRTVNKEIFNCEFNCNYIHTKNLKILVLQALLNLSGSIRWFYNRFRNLLVKLIPLLLKTLPNIFFHPRIGIEKGRWWRHRVKGAAFYYDFELLRSQKIKTRLNPFQLEQGDRIRKNLGLPKDTWFVCLHVRESGYLGSVAQHNHRDSNILNYLPAINYITKNGGYVVRLGDATMAPIPEMENVIDYAVSEYRSDLMDLYLVSQCKYFIGCDSGPYVLAWLFKKPLCCINSADQMFLWSISESDVIVPKHIFSIEKDRILSFQELINSDIYNENLPTQKYIFIENTPDEILNTVEDFSRLLEEENIYDWNLYLQKDIKHTINKKYDFYISQPEVDGNTKEYCASRIYGKGLIGKSYLENCWEYSPYLEELTLKFKEQSRIQRKDNSESMIS